MAEKTDWTLVTLKEHFELILKERDVALKASFATSQAAFDKADERLDGILQDFPQKYGRKEDYESLRKEINAIKIDHVQRREFDSLKGEQSQGRGIRIALIGTAGIVITLITVALGAMYANQLTHRDVSEQIAVEAPWLSDRAQIENEIHTLQQQIITLRTQLAAHEAADRIRALANRNK